MSNIKVGDCVPQAKFKTLGPNGIDTLDSKVLFEGKKILLVGVVGAFTPICAEQHLPDFIPFAKELKKNAVVDETVCVCVVDPFVLKAWQRSIDPQNAIKMLTDNNAEFAKAMGLIVDLSDLGLGIRSSRYVMLVENGVVSMLNIDEDPNVVFNTSKTAVAEHLVG